jgi:hypothetical protein
MVLNLSQLIKSCGTETYPAAKTQSIGLPAYAQLSQVFAEPSGSYTVTQSSQPSTGIIPSRQLCLDTETFSHLPGLSIWTQKLLAVYRDCAKTHASACRWRQLIKPPGR